MAGVRVPADERSVDLLEDVVPAEDERHDVHARVLGKVRRQFRHEHIIQHATRIADFETTRFQASDLSKQFQR